MAQRDLSDLYDPEMLAVMEQAFNATWAVLEAHDISHDQMKNDELRMASNNRRPRRPRGD